MATTFTPNIETVLGQTNNFSVPLSSSPYQALGTWEKEGGLQSIYDKYVEASDLSGDYIDETYNVTNPYKSEGLQGDVRHVVGSSMAKDQLQNLLGDYMTPGSPLSEKVTSGLGMFKTYAEELDDAVRIGKQTIQAGDWDKIWSGEFLTHPLEDIKANRIGLSIPYGATEDERLSYVPGMEKFMMNKRATQKGIAQVAMQKQIQQAEAAQAAANAAAANAAAAGQRRAGRGGSHMSRSRDQGGLGISRAQAQSISDANRSAGMSGWGLADGGLAYLLYGGLV